MASTMDAGLLSLPPEILIGILCVETLRDTDICSIAQVCKTLQDVTFSDKVWNAKFKLSWSVPHGLDKNLPPGGWLGMCQVRKSIQGLFLRELRQIADNFDCTKDISDKGLEVFLKAREMHKEWAHFLLEDLASVLGGDSNKNLTIKYYAKKVDRFVHEQQNKEKLAVFLSLPEEEQSLEKGAVLISSFIQRLTEVEMEGISRQLDAIADMVRDHLRKRSPRHPAITKDNAITGFTEHLWSPTLNMEVLDAMNHVLYKQLEFKPNQEDYSNTKNSFIDHVLRLKTGIPITMCIVYSSLARRLGVVCKPVNFPMHFLLSFKNSEDCQDCALLIDAYDNGKVRSQQASSLFLLPPWCKSTDCELATPKQVLIRMLGNILTALRGSTSDRENDGDELIYKILSVSKLYSILNPGERSVEVLRYRICLHLDMDLEQVMEALDDMGDDVEELREQCRWKIRQVQKDERNKKQVHHRCNNSEVNFSVGMVMKHKLYHYTFVIYRWDPVCLASQQWIHQMGVNRLKYKQHQPFYSVLGGDGSTRYVAQENVLFFHDVEPICHEEVGKYFEEFTGRYYLPNAQTRAAFPDDAAVTQERMDRFFETGSE